MCASRLASWPQCALTYFRESTETHLSSRSAHASTLPSPCFALSAVQGLALPAVSVDAQGAVDPLPLPARLEPLHVDYACIARCVPALENAARRLPPCSRLADAALARSLTARRMSGQTVAAGALGEHALHVARALRGELGRAPGAGARLEQRALRHGPGENPCKTHCERAFASTGGTQLSRQRRK
jgi:hypothetical protein